MAQIFWTNWAKFNWSSLALTSQTESPCYLWSITCLMVQQNYQLYFLTKYTKINIVISIFFSNTHMIQCSGGSFSRGRPSPSTNTQPMEPSLEEEEEDTFRFFIRPYLDRIASAWTHIQLSSDWRTQVDMNKMVSSQFAGGAGCGRPQGHHARRK